MNKLTAARSLAVRLSVLFALTSAGVFSLVGFYLYTALSNLMTTRQESTLAAVAAIARGVMHESPAANRDEWPSLLRERLASNVRIGVSVYSEEGTLLFDSGRVRVPKQEWTKIVGDDEQALSSRLWKLSKQAAYRVAVTRFGSANTGRGYIVLAFDVSEPVQLLTAFESSLLAGIPAGMLIAALIGIVIARRELRALVRIAKSAHDVTASQLNERLDMTNVPSEIEELVSAFNTMLARLEESFRRLSEFSADLAHELRTPLTSLLGRTQVMLMHERSASEYREALESSVEEIERLTRLVGDMLFLAQADSADAEIAHDEIDLREELVSLFEFFDIACEERGIALQAHGDARVTGDRSMVRRALSNLLSNAIRHSANGACVDVALESDPHEVAVTVTNRGAGIATEHFPRLFDRFYRADRSRALDSGGTGLGLAIVKSIMTMHGGSVEVKSGQGVTAFTLCFPSRAAPPRIPIPAFRPTPGTAMSGGTG